MRGGGRLEDKRTRVRGGSGAFSFGKGGEVVAGLGGGGVWKLHTSHLHVPPHRPSRKPGVRLDRVVRPAGTFLSPTLSPKPSRVPNAR